MDPRGLSKPSLAPRRRDHAKRGLLIIRGIASNVRVHWWKKRDPNLNHHGAQATGHTTDAVQKPHHWYDNSATSMWRGGFFSHMRPSAPRTLCDVGPTCCDGKLNCVKPTHLDCSESHASSEGRDLRKGRSARSTRFNGEREELNLEKDRTEKKSSVVSIGYSNSTACLVRIQVFLWIVVVWLHGCVCLM